MRPESPRLNFLFKDACPEQKLFLYILQEAWNDGFYDIEYMKEKIRNERKRDMAKKETTSKPFYKTLMLSHAKRLYDKRQSDLLFLSKSGSWKNHFEFLCSFAGIDSNSFREDYIKWQSKQNKYKEYIHKINHAYKLRKKNKND